MHYDIPSIVNYRPTRSSLHAGLIHALFQQLCRVIDQFSGGECGFYVTREEYIGSTECGHDSDMTSSYAETCMIVFNVAVLTLQSTNR